MVVARVAALGLLVGCARAFEVGARHVVEQELETRAEPVAVALHEVRAQRVLVPSDVIERVVEARVVDLREGDAEQVVERGGCGGVMGGADPPVRFDEGWGRQCCSQDPRPLPTLHLRFFWDLGF